MPGRLPRITGADALGALQRGGWFVVRIKGSHHMLNHPTNPGRPIIPVHAGVTLEPKTLSRVLKEAGLTADELRDLL